MKKDYFCVILRHHYICSVYSLKFRRICDKDIFFMLNIYVSVQSEHSLSLLVKLQ